MITLYRPANYDNPRAQSLCGLSADTKPLYVENGAEFREIDTGVRYKFDAENKVWIKQGDSASTYQDGYEAGYTAGVASVPDYMNQRITNSLVEYYNDEATETVSYSFQNLTNLKKVTLTRAQNIGVNSFYTCTNLKEVNLPVAISIGASAFRGCSRLMELDLPVCGTIGSDALYGDFNLVKLILRKSDGICTISGTNALYNTGIANGRGYVYVPDALVDTYKANENWATYADQIKPISELEE